MQYVVAVLVSVAFSFQSGISTIFRVMSTFLAQCLWYRRWVPIIDPSLGYF